MLGNRLELCFEMIENGAVVCDVGTDHAYLACELIKRKKCSLVVASDINKGPLEAAEKNVEEYGFKDKIPLILSDGLEKIVESEYAQRINCIVIAGMGGENIVGILENNIDFSAGCILILQPMTRENVLRKWLYQNGFNIRREKITVEGRKIYTVMKVVYTGEKSDISEALAFMGFADYSEEISKKYGTVQYNKYRKKYEALLKSEISSEMISKNIADMKENLIEAERILKNENM